MILEHEMPFTLVHLKNVVGIMEAGGTVISAVPGFYNHPVTGEKLAEFVIGKALEAMGVAGHEVIERWGRERRG